MEWDGTGTNCYEMVWVRKICPKDKPENLQVRIKPFSFIYLLKPQSAAAVCRISAGDNMKKFQILPNINMAQ